MNPLPSTPSPGISEKPKGDCFSVAGDYVVQSSDPQVQLCHGKPVNQRSHRRYWHAWVEVVTTITFPDGTTIKQCGVIDDSNDRSIHMPQQVYYKIGKLEDKHVRRYWKEEAMDMMAMYGHYGPWPWKP